MAVSVRDGVPRVFDALERPLRTLRVRAVATVLGMVRAVVLSRARFVRGAAGFAGLDESERVRGAATVSGGGARFLDERFGALDWREWAGLWGIATRVVGRGRELVFGEQAVQATSEAGVQDGCGSGGGGVQHDFVKFLRRETRLCKIQVFDLALALLVRGFLVGGRAKLVDGVAGYVPVMLGSRSFEGRNWGCAIGVAIRGVAVFVVEVLIVRCVELVYGLPARFEDWRCVVYHSHLLV